MRSPDENGALDRASDLLDEGRPEEALAELAKAPHDDPDRALVEALAHLDLGDLERARTALAMAREALPDEDPDLLFVGAELALAEWRPDAARMALEHLTRSDPSASAWSRLALCHDLADEFDAAQACLARAHDLDPEGCPLPLRLSAADFDATLHDAVQRLPDDARAAIERVRIVVEPMPFAALAPREEPASVAPDVLGLFVGATTHDLADDVSAELPPTIYLFQRNLERMASGREALEEEIRITLWHEVAHFLGWDEDGVDALGLA